MQPCSYFLVPMHSYTLGALYNWRSCTYIPSFFIHFCVMGKPGKQKYFKKLFLIFVYCIEQFMVNIYGSNMLISVFLTICFGKLTWCSIEQGTFWGAKDIQFFWPLFYPPTNPYPIFIKQYPIVGNIPTYPKVGYPLWMSPYQNQLKNQNGINSFKSQ